MIFPASNVVTRRLAVDHQPRNMIVLPDFLSVERLCYSEHHTG